MITNQGLNTALDVLLHNTTTWYFVPFTSNYTPTTADTAADFPGAAGEAIAQYVEGTRPAFVEGAASGQVTGNTGNEATITAASAVTIYGLGLSSVATKGAVTGVLLCAARFPTPKTLEAGEQLKLSLAMAGANG